MCWTFSPLSVVSPTSLASFCQSCGLMKNIAPVFVSPFSRLRGRLGDLARDVAGQLEAGRAEPDEAGAVGEHDRATERLVGVLEADVDVEVGHRRAGRQVVRAVGGDLRLAGERLAAAEDVDVDACR